MDTGGQERFRNINSSYYRGVHGIMLVYDITDLQSFKDLNSWLIEIEKNAPRKVNIILIGNKCDLENERKISTEAGKNKAKEMNCPFYETSALNNIMIEEVFKSI